jgi:hypothetical protein
MPARPELAFRDQQRVLSVEPDTAPRRGLAIDVLVRVDEHAEAAAELLAESRELLAQFLVRVVPRVARQPPFRRLERRLGSPVAESRRDHAPRAVEQRLGMTRALGLRHREAHLREQATLAPLADVTLRLGVGLRPSDSDRIEPQLIRMPAKIVDVHARIMPS